MLRLSNETKKEFGISNEDIKLYLKGQPRHRIKYLNYNKKQIKKYGCKSQQEDMEPIP